MKKNRQSTSPSFSHGSVRRKPNAASGGDLVSGVDYIGVGVGAMLFDSASRLFLAKRGPLARNERHHWEFPGGAVLLHESLKDAIRREFREEYEMLIEPERLLCIADHMLEAEDQHWVSACFIARHVSGEPIIREPNKCLGVGWFNLCELPTPLTQISTSFLQVYLDEFGRGSDHENRVKQELQLPRYISQAEHRK